MIIRNAQLERFQQAIVEEFPRRLVRLFLDDGEDLDSDPELLEQCRRLSAGAAKYGLRTEFEIAAFVACGVGLGEDFVSRPDLPYGMILKHASLAPRMKAEQILEALEKSDEPEDES